MSHRSLPGLAALSRSARTWRPSVCWSSSPPRSLSGSHQSAPDRGRRQTDWPPPPTPHKGSPFTTASPSRARAGPNDCPRCRETRPPCRRTPSEVLRRTRPRQTSSGCRHDRNHRPVRRSQHDSPPDVPQWTLGPLRQPLRAKVPSHLRVDAPRPTASAVHHESAMENPRPIQSKPLDEELDCGVIPLDDERDQLQTSHRASLPKTARGLLPKVPRSPAGWRCPLSNIGAK